jgi:membrane carboxypeptidase/penicillin-binding protein PbpC
MWYRRGLQITNEKKKVFDVQGGIDDENRNIIAYARHGKVNQQFDVVYADQWKGEPTKGQLNKDFGLYVDRTFFVISRMKGGRYLDLINNRNMVIKTRNGRKTQMWWFDQKSLTIKTRLNSQSWDIQSNGKSQEFRIWSTQSNSRWW